MKKSGSWVSGEIDPVKKSPRALICYTAKFDTYCNVTQGWILCRTSGEVLPRCYVLPVVMKSLFHVTVSVPMDVGHLPLLARLSGTLCPRTCGIRRFLMIFTGSHWIRFCLRSTSVFSALEVFFHENALYKSTFDIWHLRCRNVNSFYPSTMSTSKPSFLEIHLL